MKDKSTKVGVSIPTSLAKAAQDFAAVHTGGNLSRVLSEALREHLSAHGALPAAKDARRQSVIDGLLEAYSVEELNKLLAARTASAVVAE